MDDESDEQGVEQGHGGVGWTGDRQGDRDDLAEHHQEDVSLTSATRALTIGTWCLVGVGAVELLVKAAELLSWH